MNIKEYLDKYLEAYECKRELEDKARDGEDLVKRLDTVCLLLGDFPAEKQSIENQIGEYIKRWGK